MDIDPWMILRDGSTSHALQIFRKEYERDHSMSSAMELGAAFLWMGEFQDAWSHFNQLIVAKPHHMDVTYVMAGVAKWCLDDRAAAVRQWADGLDCEYADGAGGVEAPLLLYAAGQLHSDLFDSREAARLLSLRADDTRVRKWRNWPGPIVEFVIGRIDEVALRRECKAPVDFDTLSRHFKADFYAGVGELSSENDSRWRDVCRKALDVSWSLYDTNANLFLSYLWDAEFYLARHEAARFL